MQIADHTDIPNASRITQKNRMSLVKRICATLILAAASFGPQASICADNTPNEAEPYDGSAACDFIMARLYEVSQEILENTRADSSASVENTLANNVSNYKSSGLSAEYFRSNNNVHITNMLIDQTRISPRIRSKDRFLARFSITSTIKNQNTLTLQCDMLRADINFIDISVKDVHISQDVD